MRKISSADFDKYSAWLIPLLAALLPFAVFSTALQNGFVNWDDIVNFVETKNFRGLGLSHLVSMFSSFGMGPYTPINTLSFGLDYTLWGLNAYYYHLTNVLLHCANGLLLYFLAAEVMAVGAGPAQPADKLRLRLAALFAALVFSVHPLRAESASWLSGRHDLLCGLFLLQALRLYVRRHTSPEGGAAWPPLLFFLLALLSKAVAVTLPVALLLLDIYPLRRLPAAGGWTSAGTRRVLLEKMPYLLLSALFVAIGLFGQHMTGSLKSYGEFGAAHRLVQSVYCAFFGVWKTLLPTGLSAYYQVPPGLGPLDWPVLGWAAVLAALTAAAAALRRLWPAVPAAWFYYLVALAPVSGLLKINSQSAADRYTYLPGLGFALLAGAVLLKGLGAGPRLRRGSAVAACLLVAALAVLARQQSAVWRSSETLWRHALSVYPKLELVHDNLGGALAMIGKKEEAVQHYREALRLNPDFADASFNLGVILGGQGNLVEAARLYREVLRVRPDSPKGHYNLGVVLAAQGRHEEAARHYRAAWRLAPAFPAAPNNLGLVRAGQGRLKAAAGYYRAALYINPDYPLAHYNLGVVLAAQGQTGAAAGHYREALRLLPGYADAHVNLGNLLQAQGRLGEAEESYRAALRILPGFAAAHYNLGVVQAARGRAAQAAASFREASRLQPGIGGAGR